MYWVKNVCPLARLVSCQVQAKIMYAKSDHHCLCFYTWAWSLVDFNKFIILWMHATHALVTYCMRYCSCLYNCTFLCSQNCPSDYYPDDKQGRKSCLFVGKKFCSICVPYRTTSKNKHIVLAYHCTKLF